MGNAFGSQARRKLGDLVQERVFQRSLPAPLSPEQMEVMAQLTLREQVSMHMAFRLMLITMLITHPLMLTISIYYNIWL